MRRWLTLRVEALVDWRVRRMQPARREWGEAVVAGPGWLRWLFAGLGLLSVSPWLAVSIQGLGEREAPDATYGSLVAMLVAQVGVAASFAANWWLRRGRGGAALLAVMTCGYAGAAAFAAADNGRGPLLAVVAAVIFAGPPFLAAMPLMLSSWLAPPSVRATPPG